MIACTLARAARALSLHVALAGLVTLAACGGGGGGGDTAAPPEAPAAGSAMPTYGRTQLPGRLLVNSPEGAARLYSLTTGTSLGLPASGVREAGSPDGDTWAVTASGTALTRQTDYYASISGWHPPQRVQAFNGSGVALTAGADWAGGYFVGEAQLSHDGRYVLAVHQAPLEDARLKVFEAATGAIVKDGSLLDNTDTLLTRGAAWLPDGRYVYLVGNQLYASSPTQGSAQRLATLALPFNYTSAITGQDEYLSGQSTLVASPDGTRIAFTWQEKRGSDHDTHLWTARLDGTDLRRLTAPPNPADALSYHYDSPAWSPDGQWVAGVLAMSKTSVNYLFPSLDPEDLPPSLLLIGTTGCGNSQVFVLPASANRVALTWPTLDARYGIKVLSEDGRGVNMLTTCSSIGWLS